MSKTLTRAQVARLGGFAAAEQMTPEQRRERARKGGLAKLAKHGRSHYVRMALGIATKGGTATAETPMTGKAR